jgi:hypothetical protein
VAAGLAPDDVGPPAAVAGRGSPATGSAGPASSIVVYGSNPSHTTHRVAGSSVEVILGNR